MNADLGRRVLQCVNCDRIRAWTGHEDAFRAGWGVRLNNNVREWLCEDCKQSTTDVEYLGAPPLTPRAILAQAMGTRAQRIRLAQTIGELRKVDLTRAETWLLDIIAIIGKDRGAPAWFWRHVAQRWGVER